MPLRHFRIFRRNKLFGRRTLVSLDLQIWNERSIFQKKPTKILNNFRSKLNFAHINWIFFCFFVKFLPHTVVSQIPSIQIFFESFSLIILWSSFYVTDKKRNYFWISLTFKFNFSKITRFNNVINVSTESLLKKLHSRLRKSALYFSQIIFGHWANKASSSIESFRRRCQTALFVSSP